MKQEETLFPCIENRRYVILYNNLKSNKYETKKNFNSSHRASLVNIAAFSENIDSVPVYVYYQYKSHVDGIKRPSRVPRNIQLSLAICYEASLQQLVFIDTQHKNYRYMIVDDSNNSIAEGYLDFSNKDSISVNLTSYNPGSYTLFVWYEDCEFFGTFTI